MQLCELPGYGKVTLALFPFRRYDMGGDNLMIELFGGPPYE